MKTIEEAAEEFCEQRRLNSQGYPPKEWFKAGVEFAQIRQHITSYDELIIGQYYWIKLSDKWYPALYKFNDHFVIDGNTAVPKESISLENIEPLKHE